jgi:hypothetical protein
MSISNCHTKIMTTINLTIRISLMKLITPITQRRTNQTGITNRNINLMRVQAQNQCDRTGEQVSITYVLDVQGSLGGDERLDAGRVTPKGGIHKCSPSLRSARSSHTPPSLALTWCLMLLGVFILRKNNPFSPNHR